MLSTESVFWKLFVGWCILLAGSVRSCFNHQEIRRRASTQGLHAPQPVAPGGGQPGVPRQGAGATGYAKCRQGWRGEGSAELSDSRGRCVCGTGTVSVFVFSLFASRWKGNSAYDIPCSACTVFVRREHKFQYDGGRREAFPELTRMLFNVFFQITQVQPLKFIDSIESPNYHSLFLFKYRR